MLANDKQYRDAFNLLMSPECRGAFDLDGVTADERERYGNSLFGESVLIARRLIESGSRFVTACWENLWKSSGIAGKEMGRTPKINGMAGRDHWTQCFSVMLAGAGIRGGTVHGRSDGRAAFPADGPVTPADICSTIYHCLGINPETPVYEPGGRPVPVHHGGRAIDGILS